MLSFSRIHADEEVVVVCVPNPFVGFSGDVEIDPSLCPDGASWRVTFSSLGGGATTVARTLSTVPLRRSIRVSLASNELVVLQRT